MSSESSKPPQAAAATATTTAAPPTGAAGAAPASTSVSTAAGSVTPSTTPKPAAPPAGAPPSDLAVRPAPPAAAAHTPAKQLGDLPTDELESLAEEFGLDPKDFKTRPHLVAAIHQRRQLIATMDREAMLDVIRWARRPVPVNASREQLALEIARIRSMKFEGLSPRGLIVLAQMRGVSSTGKEPVDLLIKRLHKHEGFFARMARKRRAWVGRMIAGMLGEAEPESDYQFLPPQPGAGGGAAAGAAPSGRSATIADEIEEQGLLGGLASRVKRTADSYLNQKLDEIEQRIDRKLDEIDRRLADWRDKEIANRIRIIKVTLWASVAVAAVSLLYSYIVVLYRGS